MLKDSIEKAKRLNELSKDLVKQQINEIDHWGESFANEHELLDIHPQQTEMDFKLRLIVLKMIAQYISTKDILSWLKEKTGKEYTHGMISSLKTLSKANRTLIEKFRGEYLRDISDIPMSSKRVRLQRIENNYRRALEKGDLKQASQEVQNARDEMEGAKGRENQSFNVSFNNYTVTQYQSMSDDDLKKDILAGYEKLLDSQKKRKLLIDQGFQKEDTDASSNGEETESSGEE